MELGLRGKVALVTGAAQGIGRAIALSLAREGCALVINDIQGEALETAKGEILALGANCISVVADVKSWDAVAAMTAEAERAFGRVDVLVNNAGIARFGPFSESDPRDWEEEIGVSLTGTLNCTRAVIQGMIRRRTGKVISISSDAGKVGEAMTAVYSAAKAAVIGFTKALAREVGRHNVNVNCVCPGVTKTPMITGLPKDLEEKMIRAYPMRRLGEVGDVAAVVLFLAADVSSFVTGQAISVSGGYCTQ